MKKISLIQMFKVFLKIGAILLGGGYVIVPIMKNELVEKRNWLTEDELIDYYCLTQCLPGIIAINMSILVGYKLKKFLGALFCVFAISLSPIFVILLLANLISKIVNIPFIEGVFAGVNLSVIILIYLTVKEMWKKSLIDILTYVWFFIILGLSILKISPVKLILISIIFGLLLQLIKDVKNKEVNNV